MGRKNLRQELVIPTCYWWLDPETREHFLIPGCAARAHDPNWCTCKIPESRIERERAKRRAAEATVERLREKLTNEAEDRREMQLSLRHWLKVLRDHGIDPSQHNPS